MLRPWELQITLQNGLEQPIYLQISDAIIHAIKEGKLQPGDALPGSRRLAGLLKVNRNTVVDALDLLLAEGWLISKARKGTFVSEIPKAKNNPTNYATKLPAFKNGIKLPNIIFDDGVPDSKLAPMKELARAYREIFSRKAKWQMMGYSNEYGDTQFRKAIAEMLNYKRGLGINYEQICITRGSQMATYLTAHCLLNKGDVVLIENPGYKPAWEAFEKAGVILMPVQVDSEGVDVNEVEQLLQKHTKIKAIYVTPHHQFPTTVTLSTQRRMKLIELSNAHHFTIIEDDYDNEFHFIQSPLLPISSFKPLKNFVYIGTLSKIVAPALRIGFVVSNTELINKIAGLRKLIDVQGDNIMELALLELIQSGEIKRHLRRAFNAYKTKRDVFETLLLKHLSHKVNYKKPDGGLAYWLEPKTPFNIELLKKSLEFKGIKIMTPDNFSFDTPVQGLRIGYASLSETALETGLSALSEIL